MVGVFFVVAYIDLLDWDDWRCLGSTPGAIAVRDIILSRYVTNHQVNSAWPSLYGLV